MCVSGFFRACPGARCLGSFGCSPGVAQFVRVWDLFGSSGYAMAVVVFVCFVLVCPSGRRISSGLPSLSSCALGFAGIVRVRLVPLRFVGFLQVRPWGSFGFIRARPCRWVRFGLFGTYGCVFGAIGIFRCVCFVCVRVRFAYVRSCTTWVLLNSFGYICFFREGSGGLWVSLCSCGWFVLLRSGVSLGLFTFERPWESWIRLHSFGCALGVAGSVRVRLVRLDAPSGSLGSFEFVSSDQLRPVYHRLLSGSSGSSGSSGYAMGVAGFFRVCPCAPWWSLGLLLLVPVRCRSRWDRYG